MEIKLFEIRDSATFIPAIAINMSMATMDRKESYLAGKAGYSLNQLILFGRADNGKLSYNYNEHETPARTMGVAHKYVQEHWTELETGAVIDVEFIEGERSEPKQSEMGV
jgi:hypothetical protein